MRANRKVKRTLAVVLPLVIVLSNAGCSDFNAGFKEGFESAKSSSESSSASKSSTAAGETAAGDTAGSTCTQNRYPLFDLKTAPPEPTLAIPQPPGWEPAEHGRADIIRGVLGNAELIDVAAQFAPTAAVSLEDLTGKVETPAKAIEAELASLGVRFTSQTPGKTCGYPSVTVTYTDSTDSPVTTVTTLFVAGESEGKLYATAMTIQSTQPDDPTYVHDRDAMIEGFVFRFGSAS